MHSDNSWRRMVRFFIFSNPFKRDGIGFTIKDPKDSSDISFM